MIEYSVGDLKYYYSKYGGEADGSEADGGDGADYTKNDKENISHLEDTLSNAIDDDYINNNVYHIFPNAVAIVVSVVALAMVATATATAAAM